MLARSGKRGALKHRVSLLLRTPRLRSRRSGLWGVYSAVMSLSTAANLAQLLSVIPIVGFPVGYGCYRVGRHTKATINRRLPSCRKHLP